MKAIFLALIFVCAGALAQSFTAEELQTIIGPFPATGSVEEEKDFKIILQFQRTRTPVQCAVAGEIANAEMTRLFTIENGPLSEEEMNHSLGDIQAVYEEYKPNNHLAKELFQRPRPYVTRPEVVPCVKKESSFAYPSGHAAFAWAVARVLSKKFPKKARELEKRAEEIGASRVLSGVHHPSDIEGGKRLGLAIAEKLLKQK